jgi:hypothetical protein
MFVSNSFVSDKLGFLPSTSFFNFKNNKYVKITIYAVVIVFKILLKKPDVICGMIEKFLAITIISSIVLID